LSKSSQQLLKGYTTEELGEMFEKVADLEAEIGELLETEPEIDTILGSKMDNQTLWFYVRWGDKECSFIPAKALSKIAPEKVIKYYESILNFNPTKKEETSFGLDSLQHLPDGDKTANRLLTQRENRPRLLPQTQLQSPQPQPQLIQPQQSQPQLQQPPPLQTKKDKNNDFLLPSSSNNGQKAKSFRTMNCTGCSILLQYPEGTKAIKCPSCNTVMQAR